MNPAMAGFFRFYAMNIIILKFGGTSVSTKANIKTIASIISREINNNPVLVVSALSGVTNLLADIADNPGSISENTSLIRTKHKALVQDIWKEKKSQKVVMDYIDEHLLVVKKNVNKNISKPTKDALISQGEIMSSFLITEALAKY